MSTLLKDKLKNPKKKKMFPEQPSPTEQVKTPAAPPAEDLTPAIEAAEQAGASLPEEVKESWQTKIDKIKDAYDARDKDIESKRRVSKIGEALFKLAAGYHGLKTGKDLTTDLRPDETNWEKKLDRSLDEYKADISNLEDTRASKGSRRYQQTGWIRKSDGATVVFDNEEGKFVDPSTGQEVDSKDLKVKKVEYRRDPRTGRLIGLDNEGREVVGDVGKLDSQGPEVNHVRNLYPEDIKHLRSVKKEYAADVKDLTEDLRTLNNLDSVIAANTPGSIRAIKNLMARASGEKGVMTEQDVQGFTGVENVLGRLAALSKQLLDKEKALTPEQQKNYRKLLNVYKSALKQHSAKINEVYVTRLREDLISNASPKFLSAQLRFGDISKDVNTDEPPEQESTTKLERATEKVQDVVQDVNKAATPPAPKELSRKEADALPIGSTFVKGGATWKKVKEGEFERQK